MTLLTEEQRMNLINFLKRNKLLLFAILFLLFFFCLLIMSFTLSSQTKQQTIPNPTPAGNNVPTIQNNTGSSITPSDEQTQSNRTNEPHKKFEEEWEAVPFSEEMMQGVSFEKKQLSDGSISYTFPSDNPNRPDMIIVKNSIEVFKRMVFFDLTLDGLLSSFGKPDYIADGSSFWGADTVTYFYFERGLAYTANAKTKVVVEQIIFQPVSPNQFKQSYPLDITGDLKKP